MQIRGKFSRSAAAGLLVATAMYVPAALGAEKSFDRTLHVNGTVTLRVSTGSGYIHVSPGSDTQVHIVGHVKANNSWWGGSSDDAVAKVAAAPPIDQAGNIIRVGDNHGGDWMRHVSIDYDITTPANTMLTAESGSGSLQLSNLKGTVKAETGSGDIKVDKLGAGSKLETGSGTIEATNLMGFTSLQTGSGEIHADLSSAGDVSAGTGSGSIRLTNVQGAVKAETGSGDIDISGQPTSPWKLDTGSGSISLKLGPNARFTLDAETGSGSVRSDLTIAMRGSLDKHHVNGTVNGGGPTIKAETGSGDIHIQ
jgi:hypothetical protein